MSMSIGGTNFNANFNVKTKTASTNAAQQNTKPAFEHTRVFNSLGDFTSALFKYEDEWSAEYSKQFSEMDNGGKMTVDELREFMQNEFSSYGVRFVDSNPKDVSAGQHLVYIDEANLQKMASDPDYRTENLALMQREFAGQNGFAFRSPRGVVNSKLTSTVFSLSNENEKVGGSYYQGMAQSASTVQGSQDNGFGVSTTSGSKGKSVMEALAERQAEMRERAREKREKERLDAERKIRDERFAPKIDKKKEVKESAEISEDSNILLQPDPVEQPKQSVADLDIMA